MQWLDNKINKTLLMAVKNGSYKQIKALLWLGADPSAASERGMTALMIAAERKRSAVTDLLLERGADTKAVGPQGNTALHLAAEKGYAEIVGAILGKSTESLEIKNEKGKSPLFRAVDCGHITTVEALIAANSDVNTRDNRETTPLIKAAETGYFQITSLLLRAGANVAAINDEKESAFLRAAENSYTNIIPLLLEAGADINSRDKNGDTMLHRAARRGRTKLMTALFDRGIEPGVLNDKGETALHRTAENGHIAAALLLLEKGVSSDVVDHKGQTALMRAAHAGLIDMTRTLCERTGHDIFDPTVLRALEEARRKDQRELVGDESVAMQEVQQGTLWKKTGDMEVARLRLLPAIDQEQTEIFDFKNETYTSHSRYLSSNAASQIRQKFNEVADRDLLAEAERQLTQIKAQELLADKKSPLALPAPASGK